MAISTNNVLSTDSRRKIALVIGNTNYIIENELPNAIHDAKAMANLLKQIGFQIYDNEPKLDLNFHQMNQILSDFVREIKRSDTVLFYFAGHGIQWEIKVDKK